MTKERVKEGANKALFATAAVYFLLTWILSILLNRIKLYFDPRRRSQKQILKGVKTK